MQSKLNEIIEERGITVKWLADRADLKRSDINNYCNGITPQLDKAYAIAKALGLSVYNIWTLE